MPIFDFKCDMCGAVTEKLVKLGQEQINCPSCSYGVGRKEVSAAAVHFKGGGWTNKTPNAPARSNELSKVQSERFD